MKPRNADHAVRMMRSMLRPKLRHMAKATIDGHVERAERIARWIYARWRVGAYQMKVKHFGSFMQAVTLEQAPATQRKYWNTLCHIVEARGRADAWLRLLEGPWGRPAPRLSRTCGERPSTPGA
jgi:hypothetical protein